ncbi:hypothetical protein BCR32DRAFT_271608 [Anaeromyces robustus]|uniref:Calponin-homology (CH) domain-containing protein n=1 Tax=Anaeromyces robustus TaxID=1754192 RepID=A0A1Y1WQS4_9FUNG|nr:hypothetical protein BCR32DRAFT_271608 [Anaeromyces robustus]|eukprot:ORX75889.1 hypothetical protein BCR32DRAFT_271608 [Anaeromyces robustus]
MDEENTELDNLSISLSDSLNKNLTNDLLYKECLELSNIISKEIKDIINQVRNPKPKELFKIESIDSIKDKNINNESSLNSKENKFIKQEENTSPYDINNVIKKFNDSEQNYIDGINYLSSNNINNNKKYGIYNADHRTKINDIIRPTNLMLPYPTAESNNKSNNNNNNNNNYNTKILNNIINNNEDDGIDENNTEYHYIDETETEEIVKQKDKVESINDCDNSLPPKFPDDYTSSLSSSSSMSLTYTVSSSGSSFSSKYNNHKKRINKYSSSRKSLSSSNTSPEASFIIQSNSDSLFKNSENDSSSILSIIEENEEPSEFLSSDQFNTISKNNFLSMSPIIKEEEIKNVNEKVVNEAIRKLEISLKENTDNDIDEDKYIKENYDNNCDKFNNQVVIRTNENNEINKDGDENDDKNKENINENNKINDSEDNNNNIKVKNNEKEKENSVEENEVENKNNDIISNTNQNFIEEVPIVSVRLTENNDNNDQKSNYSSDTDSSESNLENIINNKNRLSNPLPAKIQIPSIPPLKSMSSPSLPPKPVTPSAVKSISSPSLLPRPVTPSTVKSMSSPSLLPRPVTPSTVKSMSSPSLLPRPVTPSTVKSMSSPSLLPRPVTPSAVKSMSSPSFIPRSITPTYKSLSSPSIYGLSNKSSNPNFTLPSSRRPSSSLSMASSLTSNTNSSSLLPVYVSSPKLNYNSNNNKRLSMSSIVLPSPKLTSHSHNKLNMRLTPSLDSIPSSPKLSISSLSNSKKINHHLSSPSLNLISSSSPKLSSTKKVAKYPPPAPSSYVSARHSRYQSLNENDLRTFNHKGSFERNEKGYSCPSPQIKRHSMIPLSPQLLNKQHSRTYSNSSTSSISSLPLPLSSLSYETTKNSTSIIHSHSNNKRYSTSSIPIPSPKLTFISSNTPSSSPLTNHHTNISYEDQFNTSTLLQFKDDISRKNYKIAPSLSSISSFESQKSSEYNMLKKYEKRKIREKEMYYLEWIKTCLEDYGEEDIYIDVENDRLSNILSDGVILASLVEYLSNRSVGDIYLHPKIRQDKYYNLKKVFYLIKDELFVPAKATEYDVECGDLSAILSLLGQLKDHYHRMDMKEPV